MKYDKFFKIDECLETCTFVKSIIGKLEITSDKHVDIPETLLKNSNDKKQNIKLIIIFCTLFINNLVVIKNHIHFLVLDKSSVKTERHITILII